jgi:ATP-dependent helicase/nuclease subunit A
MSWTKAQQKVIDTRNKNLLVSAAAGSGKTAVLVERIITMISEGENPIDIDHLLVVTFTNAAAAEMRERIGKAIDRKLREDPGNLHLQRQISLLQSAQITTIHSFCLNVIRNYFHRIDLDPSFKIAEDSEITLMKSDVIADILERWYEVGSEDFHAFVESYSYSKSDLPIEELVLQLFNFAMSDPWPKDWIARMRRCFEIDTMEEMNSTPWMNELLDYVKIVLSDLSEKNSQAIAVCHEAGGPLAYETALMSDRGMLEKLNQASTYAEFAMLFPGLTYERLSGKREEGVLPWKKDRVKELREEVKKGLKDLTGQFFFQSPEEMLADHQAVGRIMQVLFDLTLEFMESFARKKEEKNLIDFNDLEHFALKILVEKDESNCRVIPTQAALELSEQFDEILIDEYQDSNMVQETILRSISREDRGKPNRFMVGDVKQSIYKFRLAMPEIFMEKYISYSCEELTEQGETNYYQRIDLDKNFRSRDTVLQYVNRIFEQIMQTSVGGILYDEAASLKYGELYEETLLEKEPDQSGPQSERLDGDAYNIGKGQQQELLSEEIRARIASETELLLVTEESPADVDDAGAAPWNGKETDQGADGDRDKDTFLEPEDENEEEAVYTKKELEARAIAKRIRELTDPENGMLVFDQKAKSHRPACLKDIVILLRSMTGWSEVFVNALMQEGIPAYADTGTGYFQTLEIRTILNMLRIIDNPRQDIPLVGVLYSPMVGLTTTELALIRSSDRNVGMYSALLTFAAIQKETEQESSELSEKVEHFLKQLEYYRSLINHKPIHELIQTVLDETGYYYYACAMPGGDQRKANIDMLLAQAVRFEKGSYSGLFHFIRYIEKLHKYEVDFGEAAITGELDNTVRIMSIHKSKGLEFPIVFVAGMSKQFNAQDLRSSIVLHSELGVGPEYIDSVRRTKIPTLLKKVIQKKVQVENLGEELRVLYVAMTRAREKLILTGYLKARENIRGKEFSFFELLSAKSYLDWVLPAMVNRMGEVLFTEEGTSVWKQNDMSITLLTKQELLQEEVRKQIFVQRDMQELFELEEEKLPDSGIREEIKSRFNYSYPHRKVAGLKVKMTVSELKKLGQFQDDEQSLNLFGSDSRKTEADPLAQELSATVPAFLCQEKTAITGTDRGTLYHRVLELINLERILSREDLKKELEHLVQLGRLQSVDIKKLKLDYIFDFTTSEVSNRMRKAQKENKLYKEKQFVMGIKASEVLGDTDSDELILIQGIIDVFFEEDDALVLLDYKSDLVSEELQLVHRYKIQLQYYKRALEQMLNKKVKDMIIYSLPLGKEIRIDE